MEIKLHFLKCINCVALIFVIFTGCDNTKIQLPSSDSTAPVLTWHSYNHTTGEQKDYNSPFVTIEVKKGDFYTITFKAKDEDGGVKSIELSAYHKYQCGSKYIDQKYNYQTQKLKPDADGKVLTSIFLLQDAEMVFDCDFKDFDKYHRQIFMLGYGYNYYNAYNYAQFMLHI